MYRIGRSTKPSRLSQNCTAGGGLRGRCSRPVLDSRRFTKQPSSFQHRDRPSRSSHSRWASYILQGFPYSGFNTSIELEARVRQDLWFRVPRKGCQCFRGFSVVAAGAKLTNDWRRLRRDGPGKLGRDPRLSMPNQQSICIYRAASLLKKANVMRATSVDLRLSSARPFRLQMGGMERADSCPQTIGARGVAGPVTGRALYF